MTRQAISSIIMAAVIALAGCGGDNGGAPDTADGGPGFTGSWNLLSENGRTTEELGITSLVLELTRTTLRSTVARPLSIAPGPALSHTHPPCSPSL